MTDNEIAQIIKQHSRFAPDAANVIIVHKDGRVFFAEKFEQGSQFWDASTMLPRTLQGIIYSCSLVAKRSDAGHWVSVNDLGGIMGGKEYPTKRSPPPYVKEQMSKITNRPRPTPKEPKVEVVPATAVETKSAKKGTDWRSEFIGIKELDCERNPRNHPLFVSIRTDGKIILSKGLLDKIDGNFDFLVSKDRKAIALVKNGSMYNRNKSGNYSHKGLPKYLKFPEDSGTVRIYMDWDQEKNAFIGSL